jgi:hypothetical protein
MFNGNREHAWENDFQRQALNVLRSRLAYALVRLTTEEQAKKKALIDHAQSLLDRMDRATHGGPFKKKPV